jgi:hypothetical protein
VLAAPSAAAPAPSAATADTTAAAATTQEQKGSIPEALKTIVSSLQPLITGDPADAVRGAALHALLQAASVAHTLRLQCQQQPPLQQHADDGSHQPAQQGQQFTAFLAEMQQKLVQTSAALSGAAEVEQDPAFLGQLKEAQRQVQGYLHC